MKKIRLIINFLHQHKTASLVWISVYLLMFIQSVRDGFLFATCTSLLAIVAMGLLYELNHRVLIPRIQMSTRRPVLYLVTSLLIIAALIYVCVQTEIFFFHAFDVVLPYGIRIIFPVFRFFFLLMFTFTASNLVYSMRKAKESIEQKEALMRENQEMELRLLKSQINPHFLFNALNNIYAMSYTHDERLPDSVLKLSQMMRYVIDDCMIDNVLIQKEVEYIQNYINFQELRFAEKKDVTFTIKNSLGRVTIPPMILQPFVENCFKHCNFLLKDSYIRIELALHDNVLTFITENNNPVSQPTCIPEKQFSIGIPNVKKRLDLIYKDNYKLNIIEENQKYRVELSIKNCSQILIK